MSDLEEGKILGYWECQMPLGQIAAAVGRNKGDTVYLNLYVLIFCKEIEPKEEYNCKRIN